MELQWPLILFTTLLAWAAGLFAAQCVWALRGKGGRAQMPALITSAALLVVGGIAVFFPPGALGAHLQRLRALDQRHHPGAHRHRGARRRHGRLTSCTCAGAAMRPRCRRGCPSWASSWRRFSSSSWATPT
ncbi:MAG: hypothetical protein ACLTDR_04645 [Adlercreutzia equolifaciens]